MKKLLNYLRKLQEVTEEIFKLILTKSQPFLLFKHSNRCPISSLALNRFTNYVPEISHKVPVYLLDVVAQRSYSLTIADTFEVHHESPQIILFDAQKGVLLDASHLEISGAEVLEILV